MWRNLPENWPWPPRRFTFRSRQNCLAVFFDALTDGPKYIIHASVSVPIRLLAAATHYSAFLHLFITCAEEPSTGQSCYFASFFYAYIIQAFTCLPIRLAATDELFCVSLDLFLFWNCALEPAFLPTVFSLNFFPFRRILIARWQVC